MTTTAHVVHGIPVLMVRPEGRATGKVVLWMSHLGGSARQTLPMLERFAAAGHPAVSFDAVGHGDRGSGDPWTFAGEVLAAFRLYMWPILGQTTLDAMRVLSWATERTDSAGGALVGGVSMGGDIAVALAGVDQRVRRVATIGSTPNWSRPGMRQLDDRTKLIEQGEADPYRQWLAQHLDPSRNLEHYRSGTAITFEVGEADHHVPADNARTFAADLRRAEQSERVRVRIQTYPGLDHFGVTTSRTAQDAAIDWLLDQDGLERTGRIADLQEAE